MEYTIRAIDKSLIEAMPEQINFLLLRVLLGLVILLSVTTSAMW